MVQDNNYQAIVMNVTMPIMDGRKVGYRAVEKIREMGHTRLIIGYSALHHLEAVDMAFKAGMSHYLLKRQGCRGSTRSITLFGYY